MRAHRISTIISLLVLSCALVFLLRFDFAPVARSDSVSRLPGRAVTDELAARQSPTGYANGQRELILPGRSEDSFQWIEQTQQMFAQKEWRVHWVNYDNAPFGRAVNSASPYRWWLGLVAWVDHLFSGRPVGLSVERAALLADPILHGLLLVVVAIVVAAQFGLSASAVVALGLALTFPLAAEFLPGLPDQHGLAMACAIGSVLTLAVGLRAPNRSGTTAAAVQSRTRRWFVVAGCLGGAGLWVDVAVEAPVLIGVCLGALLAAVVSRSGGVEEAAPIPPWRLWALSGAVVVLMAYLAEYFPSHAGSWRLESIHPLYGLAWLGAGEIVFLVVQKIQRPTRKWSVRELILMLVALLAVAAIPVIALKTGSAGFLARSLNWSQLSHLPDGVTAQGMGAWLRSDGLGLGVVATLSPLLMIGSAVWLILRKKTPVSKRSALGVVLGPALVAGAFAWQQLSWWGVFDGFALLLLVVAIGSTPSENVRQKIWFGLLPATLWMMAGVTQLWPQRDGSAGPVLTSSEAQMLIERDVAHWLALRSPDERAVVYAPPNETTTLVFYGGLRGIGSFCLDNDAAVQATLKIAAAGSVQEARLLLQGRDVRYLVLPSWDSFFEDYARLFQNKNQVRWGEFFLTSLKHWKLPPWLRPLPYETPAIGGLGQQSAQIFEVVGDQKPAVAAGRLAECLLALGEKDRAALELTELQKFPFDVGALAAEAQVRFALNDSAGFDRVTESLLLRLHGGADRYLPWDRRVSVAIVLARAKHPELARLQVQQCAAAFDEEKAASLSAGSLYNLLGLARSFGVEIKNAPARAWSLQLLPLDMRNRLE